MTESSEMAHVNRLATNELTVEEIAEIRGLMLVAFADDENGAFTDDDWEHSIGGTHFVLRDAGRIICHASVVERDLHVDGKPLRTGYVEAVATLPELQGRGFGTAVMREVNDLIATEFDLGALGTGSHHFYERLGWQVWRGQTFVRTDGGLQRTPDEEGDILVLSTPRTPALDLGQTLSCEWRPGDVW
ncbi:MAG: GNAT family N-acetyltransferase [Candidatus Limnocylindrales bacterium]